MKKELLGTILSCFETSSILAAIRNFLFSLILKIEYMFVPEKRKIWILKKFLINIYKDYEETTGYVDLPYFVRAKNKLDEIIRENKVNYYYEKVRKHNDKY